MSLTYLFYSISPHWDVWLHGIFVFCALLHSCAWGATSIQYLLDEWISEWNKCGTLKEFSNSGNLANGSLKMFSVPMGVSMSKENKDML